VNADGWDRVRLRFTAKVAPSTPIDHLRGEDEVPFLPLEAIWPDSRYDASRSRPVDQVASGYTRFAEGDVLVPKITPTFQAARSAIAQGLRGGVGFGTTELHVVRPGADIDGRFLWYRTLAHDFVRQGTGAMVGVAGQKRVPAEFVKDFEFRLPPMAEQRRITRFLDREVSRLDDLRRLKEAQSTALSERLKAVMFGAVAELPRNAKLGYCGRWLSGGTPPKDELIHWAGPMPWASTKDLGKDELGDTVDHISAEAAGLHSRVVPPGSLLIATRGMALAKRLPLAVTSVATAFNQDLKALAPVAEIETAYLRIAIRAYEREVLAAVVESAHGTRRLETRHLKSLRIPLPPLDVQRRIVAETREFETRNQVAIAALDRQVGVLRERREAVITAAVNGELDPAPAGTAAVGA
jgi:type I restriction enzyme S subunit